MKAFEKPIPMSLPSPTGAFNDGHRLQSIKLHYDPIPVVTKNPYALRGATEAQYIHMLVKSRFFDKTP